jgi:hypothetical protein
MFGIVSALTGKLDDGESRHDSATSAVVGAMKEARAGYYSAEFALDTLRKIFVHAAQQEPASSKQGAKRTKQQAISEWHGIVAWAVGQANAADLDAVHERVSVKMPEKRCDVAPVPLPRLVERFRYWFGDHYDLDALYVTLAVAAVERLDGEPLWLLVISGPGATKTETVSVLERCPRTEIVSTLTSPGALLSATSRKERGPHATGGLLRKLEPQGIMVLKDVTSILSLNPGIRAEILAALREVYDGLWARNCGSDGGQTLTWKGRIAVVGAATTAWDTHHAVVAAMGDRFLLLRVDSTQHRTASGRKAIGNTGKEAEMRAELRELAAGVLAGIDASTAPELTEYEQFAILDAANLATLARTAVEHDSKGDVIDSHMPEMPTRFAKQLTQLVRGLVVVGIDRDEALRLAMRCAHDSIPPLRLAILKDLAASPYQTPTDVRRRLGKPRSTIDRALQDLHILGLVTLDEADNGAFGKTTWYYSLSDGIDPSDVDPQSL